MEFTVCSETNFQDTKQRRVAKNTELAEEVEERGILVDLITLKVDSRLFTSYDGIC